MATCPKCMGALTEDHRCPRGLLSRATDAASTMLIGGVAGGMFCYAVEDGPPRALVLAAAALGAVLAAALRQAVSSKR